MMGNKTTVIGNEEEYDDFDRAIIEQANLLTTEEFKLMQMWFIPHIDGLGCVISDVDNGDSEMITGIIRLGMWLQGVNWYNGSTMHIVMRQFIQGLQMLKKESEVQ